MKIALIAEQSPAVRQRFVSAVSKMNYFVLETDDGIELLDMLGDKKLAISLLITSVELPFMNISELLRKLSIVERDITVIGIAPKDHSKKKELAVFTNGWIEASSQAAAAEVAQLLHVPPRAKKPPMIGHRN